MSATAQAVGPVLVGVDGSRNNASAVAWSAAEASSSPGGIPLVLVHDVDGSGGSLPAGRAVLERAVTEAASLDPLLRPVGEITEGGPASSLRDVAERWTTTETDGGSVTPMLVVGRRGRGATRRVRLGTTSRRLVHDLGPLVVVIPDDWSVDGVDPDAPVVVDVGDVGDAVGAVGADDAERALAFALARAARDCRTVVAVAVWSVPELVTQLNRAIREVWTEHADRAERALEALLAPWRTAYPAVELVGVPTDRHAVSALLDHADGAEILVAPRGDRASALVEYAECPVAVV